VEYYDRRRTDGCSHPVSAGPNREIAAALFLSPPDGHHVTAVLRERGLRSRTELALAFAAGARPGISVGAMHERWVAVAESVEVTTTPRRPCWPRSTSRSGVLAEDLALQNTVAMTGLPLDMRTELHVKADRLGVALRRELASFVDRATS